MIHLNVLTFSAVLGAIALVFLCVWSRLPSDARQPLSVYVGSYVFTYCIGGIWIGLTDGDALGSYFRDRLYIPSIGMLGVEYWYVLLAPLLVPICFAAVLTRRQQAKTPAVTSHAPERWQFAAVFSALCAFAVYRVFHGGYGVIEALLNLRVLYGDTATIIERRLELFDIGTTAAFGIVYSTLPALCHVALFRAKQAGGSWRVIAAVAILVTFGVSLATFQIAPSLVLMVALLISATHLQFVRMSSAKAVMFGVAFLLVVQGMNGWKFAEWTFVDNFRHLVLRMPAAYPYYLDCFPDTVPFLGADWLGALTGHGTDPGGPFVVARYMYPDGLSGGAMAAPAHVQGYAEGGVLYSMICVGVVGMLIAGVSALSRKSRQNAMWHAAYIQGIVAIYYSTQTSFRGIVWHSYGIIWTALPLGLLMAAALKTGVSPLGSIIPRAPAPMPLGSRVHAELN